MQPFVEPSAASSVVESLRYRTVTWLGVAGGTLTLFDQVKNLVQLSEWASRIADGWHVLSERAWQFVGDIVGVEFPSLITPVLSFAFFVVCMGIGYRVGPRGEQTQEQSAGWLARSATGLTGIVLATALALLVNLIIWPLQGAIYYLAVFLVPMVSVISFASARNRVLLLGGQLLTLLLVVGSIAALIYVYSLSGLISGSGMGRFELGFIEVYLQPIALFLSIASILAVAWMAYAHRDRMLFALFCCLTVALIALVAVPINRIYYATDGSPGAEEQFEFLVATVVVWILPFILLSLASVPYVTNRLAILISGVAALLLLNAATRVVTQVLTQQRVVQERRATDLCMSANYAWPRSVKWLMQNRVLAAKSETGGETRAGP
jgi:hypothetical protein